ncbi:hypothetical protein CDCA_CDCA07G2141 [Cyanidium caldarium]|uniref:Glycoside hydrolase family 31 TIM barrel domain-containing protein n=1 Tax=Cyanidium caldarium TaxID=2771 RepID=A0AAV9IVJ4_CYACA|nr:hypothetical protein CDCA_CDCA07G2141 [Cyanidium caldarium]
MGRSNLGGRRDAPKHPPAVNQYIRVTVLNARLVRVEAGAQRSFIDAPSFAFWRRDGTGNTSTQPVTCQRWTQEDDGGRAVAREERVLCETSFLRITEQGASHRIWVSSENGRKLLLDGEWQRAPPYRLHAQNEGGTCQTLDGCDGWMNVHTGEDIRQSQMQPGWYARDGLCIIDDSDSLVYVNGSTGRDGEDDVFYAGRWMRREQLLGAPPGIDLYAFEHTPDATHANFADLLREFLFPHMGQPPKPPSFVFGIWYSRYWAYHASQSQALVRRFRGDGDDAEDDPATKLPSTSSTPLPPVPLSVLVLDMDWHQPDQWTGFSWNRDLFPDPPAFLSWLHAGPQPVRVTLNLHPADGIAPEEDRYDAARAEMSERVPPGQRIAFHISDAAFRRAYFRQVLHPLERQGVDFWWIDWQQGESAADGFDPMPLLNHYHYVWSQRVSPDRAVIFSRWPGAGGHRYPIGFSGDTVVSWSSLQVQPQFTAQAANVGCFYWSHDIGGHYGGIEDGELYTRWVQFGCWSPILRLHCSKNAFMSREPWAYASLEVECTARQVMRLRAALMPFLDALEPHRPICAPMYHYPWAVSRRVVDGRITGQDTAEDNVGERDSGRRAVGAGAPILPFIAFQLPNQYYFGGPHIIAAPFVTPTDATTQLAAVSVHLPPCRKWIAWPLRSAQHSAGGPMRVAAVPSNTTWRRYGALASMNVFLGEGAILPRELPRRGRSVVDIVAVLGQPNTLQVPLLGMQLAVEGPRGDVFRLQYSGTLTPVGNSASDTERSVRVTVCQSDVGGRTWCFRADHRDDTRRAVLQFTAIDLTTVSVDAAADRRATVALFLRRFRLPSEHKQTLYDAYLEREASAVDVAPVRELFRDGHCGLSASQAEALRNAHQHGMHAYATPYEEEDSLSVS